MNTNKNTKTNTKTVIFTAGLPGAGKSTVIKKSQYVDIKVLDCDAIKKQHPAYNPKNPSLVHDWSKEQLKKLVNEALTKNESVILDSTGTNVNRMLTEINAFKKAGFQTVLLYVNVSLPTALERNSKRERTVDNSIIHEKYKVIEKCMSTLRDKVDVFQKINND